MPDLTDQDIRAAYRYAALGLYLPLLGLIPAMGFTLLAIRRSRGEIGWPVLWVNAGVFVVLTLISAGQLAQRHPPPW